MRLCRFGDSRLGIVEGSNVRDVTAALDILPAYRYPLPGFDPLIANLDAVIGRIQAIAGSAPVLPLEGLKLLSPVANPGKIIAAPVNYQKHLSEVAGDSQLNAGNPGHTITIQKAGLFLKANSALVGPGEGIALRHLERRNDHEVELAVVIGKRANNVSRKNALAYVAGYSIGLDITIRGSEDRSFRKSPDSYMVLGPWLVTADEISHPGELDLSIVLNGETKQDSNTRHMTLGVAELIEMASSFYTLFPGDIIITGTPEGVSPIVPGDVIVAAVGMIGSMEVKVRAAEAVAATA
ncbi:MAG TPA: fumarylacetoacetate hydrolase family protein [Bryobacteraceae bacterium]|jgi:2-keto-4-pentenoate hydratase/2-oxohepta-3-ene-1,7-dioic acid hydratase in catechol pathway